MEEEAWYTYCGIDDCFTYPKLILHPHDERRLVAMRDGVFCWELFYTNRSWKGTRSSIQNTPAFYPLAPLTCPQVWLVLCSGGTSEAFVGPLSPFNYRILIAVQPFPNTQWFVNLQIYQACLFDVFLSISIYTWDTSGYYMQLVNLLRPALITRKGVGQI